MPDTAPDTTHGRQCVLLFGMPRSGTTWLGKLFDSHPHVLYRHEPDTWRSVRIAEDTDPARPGPGDELRAFMAMLPDIRAIRVAGKRPLFPKAWTSGITQKLASGAVEIARVASRVYPDFPVLVHANGKRDPERVVVWKSIQSLPGLGSALRTLDQARGIHILRHPCGYIASIRRGMASNSFSNGAADSNAYGAIGRIVGTPMGEQLGFDKNFTRTLKALTPEERLAWMWVVSNESARRNAQDTGRYMAVRYEDVCREPLAQVTRMFSFCNLAMQPQTEAFISASTGKKSQDGYYSVYKNPEAAAWRWQQELDAQTIERIMAIATRSESGRSYLDLSPPATRSA